MNISIPENLKQFLINHQCYLVGGAVRNALLQINELKDFDFVIFDCKNLRELSQNLADNTGSAFVELDNETDTYRIVNEIWQADITAPRGASLLEDLKARDFTINAIAYNLQDGVIHDPLDGQEDLQNKIVKAISFENLQADPLRILRAYRLAAQTQFKIEKETQNWIRPVIPSIDSVAKERISHEIWLLLAQQNCFEQLTSLFEVGLWEKIFPEFEALRKVPPNDFHHLPLHEHTFELVKQYEKVVRDKLPEYAKQLIETEEQNKITFEAIVKMGCLLHDIAKPDTWKIVENKHTFYGHDKLGAEKTEVIGKRLLWPKQVIFMLASLVNYHLRPFQVAPLGNEATEKAERRFFRQLGNCFYPLIALAWADLLSTRGNMVSDSIISLSEERLLKLCEHYKSFSEKEIETPLLLKSDFLMQAIDEAKLPPTKIIKELLAELRDLQLSGSINSEEEAYQWFVKTGQSQTS